MGIWMAKVAGGFGRKNISTTLFFFAEEGFNGLILCELAQVCVMRVCEGFWWIFGCLC
jgi:hypothetical protein